MIAFEFAMEAPFIFTLNGWKRGWDRVRTGIHAFAGKYWHKHILKRHFQPGAMDRYGYQERTEGHLKAKLRLWHHDRRDISYAREHPLHYMGRAEAQVKSLAMIRTFPSRFSVQMRSPSYMGMRPKKPSHPNMGQEIATVPLDELLEMQRAAQPEAQRLMELEMRKKAKWLFK